MQSINFQLVQIPIEQKNNDPQSSPFIVTDGKLYGSGQKVIIFSNMDTNNQNEWDSVVNALIPCGYMILTYDYLQYGINQTEVLKCVISFVQGLGAEKIILIGASRGGVASIKIASDLSDSDYLVGVVALSAPIEHEGVIFYSNSELSRIKIPKLIVNSESDDGATDSRTMHRVFCDPKKIIFYPGDAHGTELFIVNEESLIKNIRDFIESAFLNDFGIN